MRQGEPTYWKGSRPQKCAVSGKALEVEFVSVEIGGKRRGVTSAVAQVQGLEGARYVRDQAGRWYLADAT